MRSRPAEKVRKVIRSDRKDQIAAGAGEGVWLLRREGFAGRKRAPAGR
jgi:hypothetical protein